MKCKFLVALLVTVSSVTLSEPEPLNLGILEAGLDYALDTVIDDPEILFNPPENNNNSIQYILYTEERRRVPCFIEPSAEQFDKCTFNPNHETIFLIHGYVAKLPSGNRFEDIKNALQNSSPFNVIIVNWTKYNNFPFTLAYRNAKIVGMKVAEIIKFIMNRTGVSPETLYCIGHSLGAHVCGQAGRLTPNFGRITGLDPGGISKFLHLKPNIRLRYTDAKFVDVIHTSDIYSGTGTGFLDPLGHMDFYPNGGVEQSHCKIGRRYKLITEQIVTIITPLDKMVCNHYIVLAYFKFSIMNNCRFIATKCHNYSSYKQNLCSTDGSAITAEMGFPSEKISGLPPNSKFFLDTLEFPPYCKRGK